MTAACLGGCYDDARSSWFFGSSSCCFRLALRRIAVEARQVVTTQNSDYFGFDLRSEQNVTLDQCKTTCLGDSSCRAFTYNTKAKWCFLKSDFAVLKPFNGAVAGKVVNYQRRSRHRRAAGAHLLPGLDGRRSPPVSRQSLTNGIGRDRRGRAGCADRRRRQALLTGDPRTRHAEIHRRRGDLARRRRAVAEAGARGAGDRSPPTARKPRTFQRDATLGRLQRLPAAAHRRDARRRACASLPSASTAATSSARRFRPMRRASRW